MYITANPTLAGGFLHLYNTQPPKIWGGGRRRRNLCVELAGRRSRHRREAHSYGQEVEEEACQGIFAPRSFLTAESKAASS